jgi:outer membrane receptor protein involved in Fe transport
MAQPYRIKYNLYLIVILFCVCEKVGGQPNAYVINRAYDNMGWEDFVAKVEQNFSVHFYYPKDSLPAFRVFVGSDSTTLMDVLKENLMPLSVYVAMDGAGNIFLTKNAPLKTELPFNFFDSQEKERENTDTVASANDKTYLKTKNAVVIKTLVVGTRKKGAYSTEAIMSGFISNKTNATKIAGAVLYFQELKSGVTTDANGFYSVKLKRGNYILTISSFQSEDKKFNLEVYSDDQVSFLLDEKINLMNEVSILAEGDRNVKSTSMGFEQLTMKEIKRIPRMMGENDIIKTTLLLPGVQSVGEGTAGFNVRGSPADQNMFYINQVPVYNTTHLLGFFSAFPPNAISDLTLYKSSFPSQFGGHLSSVFDLTARQGDKNKFSMRGGISPVTANLLAEGPIAKEKSSYMLAVRSTYSAWVLKQINVQSIRESAAHFDDAIANFSLQLNSKNKLNVLTYYSSDEIKLASLTAYNYQNLGGSIKWSHFIKDKHNLDFSAVYCKYNYTEDNSEYAPKAYKINYGLNHLEAKTNLRLVPNKKHQLNIGANSILYLLDQGNFKPLTYESLVVPVNLSKEQGVESGIYVNEKWEVTPEFSVDAGLRYNFYSYLGPQKSYVYREGAPKEIKSIVDSVNYPFGANIKSYAAPDFRFTCRYSINESNSVKVGFNQVHQYIFMLTNTIALSPTDKWKLADNYIKPMSGEQYSAGFFSNSRNNRYEFSTELYYKNVNHLVEYKDGANLVVNPVPETDVLQGKLGCYGLELMIKKKRGRINGWVNYTYSRATVLVNGKNEDEKINFGNPYPANYDKPHAFNFVFNYDFSHTFSIASSIVYASGRPVTYPTGVYYQNSIPILNYSTRNEYRIPDYFRVDLSINMEGNLKAKKYKHSSWSFSVYNLLGRDNPYSIYFKQEAGLIKGHQLSIFGNPIFSFSYNFKFGVYEN